MPEIASRAHVERILPVIDEALRKAGVSLAEIDAVAVANTPGLAGSLLVGLVAAKAICLARGIPLVAVNHLQAHVYACRLAAGRDVFPCVGLIVSGGHTSLYRCRTPLDFEFLGGTIDDAAGEAFDKVAAMLGLPYPGGPSIERAAAAGNPTGLRLPAGLAERGPPGLQLQRSEDGRALRDREEAGFCGQARMSAPQFLWQTRMSTLLCRRPGRQLPRGRGRLPGRQGDRRAGADRHADFVRRRGRGGQQPAAPADSEETDRRGFELHIAPPRLCTDNAVMGAIAIERWKAGLVEPLDLDVFPGVVRNPDHQSKSHDPGGRALLACPKSLGVSSAASGDGTVGSRMAGFSALDPLDSPYDPSPARALSRLYQASMKPGLMARAFRYWMIASSRWPRASKASPRALCTSAAAKSGFASSALR